MFIKEGSMMVTERDGQNNSSGNHANGRKETKKMKINIEGSPEEIAKLLHAIESSKEQHQTINFQTPDYQVSSKLNKSFPELRS